MKSILTVTTAADSYDLTSVDTVKAELGLTDNAKNTQLATFIRQVSGAIASHCNRIFALETVRERIWPDAASCEGVQAILLKRFPIASVASLTEDGVTLEEDTDFIVQPLSGLLYRLDGSGNPTPWTATALDIGYDGGFTLLSGLPYPVERAAITMVKQAYFKATRDPSLKSKTVEGVGSQEFWVSAGTDGNMTPDVVDLLAAFRVVTVA